MQSPFYRDRELYFPKINSSQFLLYLDDPRFEFISPNPFRVNHTDAVIFTCRVKASPKPFVWWVVPSTILKDNRLTYSTSTIVDKTEFGSVEAKLTITNIGKRDYGDFFCRTNNTLTSKTRLSKLIVQCKTC